VGTERAVTASRAIATHRQAVIGGGELDLVSLAAVGYFGSDATWGELQQVDMSGRVQDLTGTLEILTRLLAEGVRLDQVRH
jgi:hypothetical protein